MDRVGHWVWLLAALQGGCIIGSWPQPEDTAEEERGGAGLAEEICNEADDDLDGVVDEGCPCAGDEVRGCIGTDGQGRCGVGVQRCVEGTWGDRCTSVGPPYTQARAPFVSIDSVDPEVIVHSETEAIDVVVRAGARCERILVHAVEIVLHAAEPRMRVRAVARRAGDGTLRGSVGNPFGPGVSPQNLTLRAARSMGERDVDDARTVPLEAP